MKKTLFLILPVYLFAVSPFETIQHYYTLDFSAFESTQPRQFDLSAYETHKSKEFTLENNEKVRCAYVCDKRKYKADKIVNAISFYKNSCDYEFKY